MSPEIYNATSRFFEKAKISRKFSLVLNELRSSGIGYYANFTSIMKRGGFIDKYGNILKDCTCDEYLSLCRSHFSTRRDRKNIVIEKMTTLDIIEELEERDLSDMELAKIIKIVRDSGIVVNAKKIIEIAL